MTSDALLFWSSDYSIYHKGVAVVCRIMSAVDDSNVSTVSSASSICGALFGQPSFWSLWHQSSHPSVWGRMIDKYLNRRPVPRRQWKLVGIAAMLIAWYFEGICPSKVQIFVYITTKVYTRDEFIEVEVWILAALELRISTSTAAHFLKLVGKPADAMHGIGTSLGSCSSSPSQKFCDWTLAITSCVLCRAFPETAGWTCVGRILSFPGVSPSCSAARALTERGLLSQHVVGGAHA